MGLGELGYFFNPRTIAVVGASKRPGSFGYEIMRNLSAGYKGEIYPVNPNYDEILGYRVYPSLNRIRVDVDLVVVAVKAERVPGVLDEAGSIGVKAAIIVSGGFSESGEEGRRLEYMVRKIALSHGIRVIGPNCIGVYDSVSGVDTFFLPRERMNRPPKGQVVLIGQSGALLTMMMDIASIMNIGIYRAINLGNRVDVSEEELIEYMINDDYAKVFGVYIEGLRRGQGRRLMSSINKAIEVGKSIVILKGGRGSQGAKAAYSHTASLAGDYNVFKAAMTQAGAVIVEDPLDLLDSVKALSMLRPPKGRRVGVITNAGGPGVIAVDALSSYGLEVPRLDARSIERLRSMFPSIVSVENPVDLTGGAEDRDYSHALSVVADSERVDMILVIAPVQPATLSEGIVDVISSIAFRHKDKPLVVSMIGSRIGEKLSSYLESLGIPVYRFPTRAAYALYTLWSRYKSECGYKYDKRSVITVDSAHGKRLKMPDHQALSLARSYGIEVPRYCLASDTSEVEDCFYSLRKPIVAKVDSPDIIHKSDVGGVIMGINTLRDALDAYKSIESRISGIKPGAEVNGILYQEMVVDEGVELIVGGRHDPAFGPAILFGSGGIGVEILKDYTIRITPITECHVREMLDEVKIGALIKGYRGKPPLSIEGLTKTLTSLSRIMEENHRIIEAEINPLILTRDKAIAVDVRIILATQNN